MVSILQLSCLQVSVIGSTRIASLRLSDRECVSHYVNISLFSCVTNSQNVGDIRICWHNAYLLNAAKSRTAFWSVSRLTVRLFINAMTCVLSTVLHMQSVFCDIHRVCQLSTVPSAADVHSPADDCHVQVRCQSEPAKDRISHISGMRISCWCHIPQYNRPCSRANKPGHAMHLGRGTNLFVLWVNKRKMARICHFAL